MQQVIRSFTLTFSNLPRSYLVIFGLLTVITLAFAICQPYVYSLMEKRHNNYIPPMEDNKLNPASKTNGSLDLTTSKRNKDIKRNALDGQISENLRMHKYIITTGDTLSNILTKYGISISDIVVLAQQNPMLSNLKIGQSLSWELNSLGVLQRLIWNVSHRETRTYNRVDGAFKESITNITGKWHSTTLIGQLNGSFISSARAAGLTYDDINEVIKALQWQLDFRKLQKGEQFSALTSREILDGKSIKSQLLGVRLRTGGRDYYAFRADDGKFYNQNASSLASGFMRFPTVKQFHVSSNFNPRRLNPVTGRIAPHRGVDFAVPVGTPVLAVSAGEVIASKRDGAAGNYVAIRHGRQYITRYMHLKKLLVKPGQNVKQGERIALSGNTGRSTSPHLHYEVWINQQAVNPLTAKLPCTEGLTGNFRAEYLAQVEQMLPQLQLN